VGRGLRGRVLMEKGESEACVLKRAFSWDVVLELNR